MTKKPYQKPVLDTLVDMEAQSVLCTSDWTDGSIGDSTSDWNNWGEI